MTMMKTILATAAFVFFSSTAGAEAVAPDVLVKNTANEVLEIVKNDKDIQAGDQKKIYALAEQKILPHFNFERMSRDVLGKYWNRATKEQQDTFTKEFRELVMHTYSLALSKYRNQTIEYKPLRAQPGDTNVKVKTQILQSGGEPVPVDYTLEKTGDEWKVYDVTIAGVSLVTNYRGQFSNEMRRGGMDGLIKKLVDKNNHSSSVTSASNKQG